MKKGYFSLPLNSGKYKFIFSYTGYVSDTLQLTVHSDEIFLGVIKLEPADVELDAVTVKAKNRDFKLDKEVQLVTKKMRVGAANTSDVLGKMQGLTYDRYNNSIKVDGDDHVILLVNGLEKDQEYIRNIPSERIKEIEIIRNPSGRYALEGYTAVINIIMKMNYSGSELYFSESMYIDLDAKKEQMLPINYTSATYNYTRNRINFYAKYRNSLNEFHLKNTTSKQINDNFYRANNPSALGDENNISIHDVTNRYTLGVDYYLNPRHTISFETNITALPKRLSNNDNTFEVTETNAGIENIFDTKNSSKSESQNFTNTLFYIYKIGKTSSINANFTFSKYDDESVNIFSEYFRDVSEPNASTHRTEIGDDDKLSTKFIVEFEHSFDEKNAIQIGYGNTWQKMENSMLYEYTLGSELVSESETSNFESSEYRHKLLKFLTSPLHPDI